MSRIDDLIAELAPEGVRHVALSEVAEYSPTRVDAANLDETSFVGVDNLVSDKGGRVDASYPPNTARLTAYEPGDILLGNIRPYLKKVWLATNAGGCSGDVLAVRIVREHRESLDPAFLYYLLSSDSFFAYNMQHAKGAKMPRGNKSAILNYRIPVPPLEVQREIVRVLDQFTQLEAELEAELAARKKQYEYYRDALLTFDEDGGASVERVPLSEIASFSYGLTARAEPSGDYRFIRITDITPQGKLSQLEPRFVSGVDESGRYLVGKNDLLMARTGATYGKTLLYAEEDTATYASFLIKIDIDKTRMHPTYYWHFAQSSHYWSQVNRLVSTGGQPQFNANLLRKVIVSVPSLKQQQRLVESLNAFDSLTSDLSSGLPAELEARRKQYEYYRDRLLTFKEKVA